MVSKGLRGAVKVGSEKAVERRLGDIYRTLGKVKRGRCPKCGQYVKFELTMHCPRCQVLVPHFSPEQLRFGVK